MAKLVRADVHGKFLWEPTAPDVVPADAADDNSSHDFVFAPAAVPVADPLPPVSVPAIIGVGAGQRAVLTVPIVETELQSIHTHVSHVRISSAPRGKMAVRRRNGSILKADVDPEVLFHHVLDHVPDWRDTLSFC